jgi:hypothetical protein
MYAPASRLMMRNKIPAIVSAGRAAGSIMAIIIIPFNVVTGFIGGTGSNEVAG